MCRAAARPRVSRANGFWLVIAAQLVALAIVVTHDALRYPPVAGTDAETFIAYADGLRGGWRLPPESSRAYDAPPGFFVVAAGATSLGARLGLAEPSQAPQLVNAALTVLTGMLLVILSRIVLPGRPRVTIAALGFFAACPAVVRHASMYHPQPLASLLGLAAIVTTTHLLVRRKAIVAHAAAIGILAGLAQLVRNVGLWSLVSAVLAIAVAAIVLRTDRRRLAGAAAGVLAIGMVIPLPWMLYVSRTHGDPILSQYTAPGLAGDRARAAGGEAARPGDGVRTLAARGLGQPSGPLAATALSDRNWLDVGLPEVLTAPYRPDLRPTFAGTLYADTWGDYYGYWAWGSRQVELTPHVHRRLVAQSIAGLAPTAFAIVGVIGLIVLTVRSPSRRIGLVPLALYPMIGLAAMIAYAARSPSPDGDTVKAVFALPILPAVAIAFGVSVDALARRHAVLGTACLGILAASLAVSLAFGVL